MAASHYAYTTLKMLGPLTVITVPSDKKDALIYADQLYREAVAAAAAKALHYKKIHFRDDTCLSQ